MLLRYYNILILLIIINGHIFSYNIIVNETTKDTIYVEFSEYEPNRYEIFNLYNSRIELDENTIYEKLLGSAYYTGNQENEGSDLRFLFRSYTDLPESYYIVPTGQILKKTSLSVEDFKETVKVQEQEKKTPSDWRFDTSLSAGGAIFFFEGGSYINYRINPGIIYKDVVRVKISPIVFGDINILLNTSIELSTHLNFENSGGIIYIGFYPYQKLNNSAKYLVSFGSGYKLNLFESRFFLELATEANIVTYETETDEIGYETGFDFDVLFAVLASIGYSY